jgi:RHH-type proline utilization regulon transcriptional repressor/proline dehydrogenase/delta 1-pyrroline-5-carboxylate dehydrogenase
MSTKWENRAQELGQDFFQKLKGEKPGIFNKAWWQGQIMEFAMKDESFKTEMFRFVDVFPVLQSSAEIYRHLKEYLFKPGIKTPPLFKTVVGLGSFMQDTATKQIASQMEGMAKGFICGQDGKSAFEEFKKLRKQRQTFTADLLGEATISEPEAETYVKRYIDLIESLAQEAKQWPQDDLLDKDDHGSIPQVNVSIKVSAMYSQLDALAFDLSVKAAAKRLVPVFQRAKALGVFLNLDMEHYALKDMTYALFKKVLEDPSLKDYQFAGVVVQAYLRDSEKDLLDLIAWAKSHGKRITIRLVKGAYWDHETIHAQQEGWPAPVWLDKADSDAHYEKLTALMLENHKYIRSAIASHNLRSIAVACAAAEHYKVPKNGFEIQCLYGMAEPIKAVCVNAGYRVRVYAPIGELIPGMAYLVRRLLENTSNEGWLKQGFADGLDTKTLLAPPKPKQRGPFVRAVPQAETSVEHVAKYVNEPFRDFADQKQRQAFALQVQKVGETLQKTLPLRSSLINGQAYETKDIVDSIDPSKRDRQVGKIAMCDASGVEKAILEAQKAQKDWASTPATERAKWLFKVAAIMRARRDELSAWMVYEVGKPWREADADVCEAIDFCEYYGREALRISKPQMMQNLPGESNLMSYQARGICAVIAPWNFPLAILVGMSVAAAVTGNAVIMKPAEQSMVIAHIFAKIALEAGIPPAVFQLLLGTGEEVGARLVRDPRIQTIAFTGSRAVGLEIWKQAGQTLAGQRNLKRVICEMGGKNAVIVDNDADLDEAVQGVLKSAFGFAGQKCSACSRVIVVEPLYEQFKQRLVQATQSLTVVPSFDSSVSFGPVIDQEAYDRLLKVMQDVAQRGTVLTGGQAAKAHGGFFLEPTIVENLSWTDFVWTEEQFGPILALQKVQTFEEALQKVMESEYALTGGLFSRSPSHIEQAKEAFAVGNLYINRSITGAIVGRHPFGGYQMSGGGTKAGGPDYLLQFVNPRHISENTQRRGFAPNLDSTDD